MLDYRVRFAPMHAHKEAAKLAGFGAEKILDTGGRGARYYPQFYYSKLLSLRGIYRQ